MIHTRRGSSAETLIMLLIFSTSTKYTLQMILLPYQLLYYVKTKKQIIILARLRGNRTHLTWHAGHKRF